MAAFYWAIVGVYLAIGVAVLIANALPHAQERSVLKFATSVGVALPNVLAEPIRRRILSGMRGNVIGGTIGVVLSTWAFAAETSSGQFVLGPLAMVGGAFAGSAVGNSVAAILSVRRAPDHRVRYARAIAVELNDYVSRTERSLARVSVALAVVSLLAGMACVSLGWAHFSGSWSVQGSVIFALTVVASLVVFEVVGRRVVAMGNHVGSPEELVWEDAMRSRAVREIAYAPVFLGLYGILLSNFALTTGEPGAGSRAIVIVAAALSVAAVVIAVGALIAALLPHRHFLRRLWPVLAAEADSPRPVDTDS